jgi:hypothetical protein
LKSVFRRLYCGLIDLYFYFRTLNHLKTMV